MDSIDRLRLVLQRVQRVNLGEAHKDHRRRRAERNERLVVLRVVRKRGEEELGLRGANGGGARVNDLKPKRGE